MHIELKHPEELREEELCYVPSPVYTIYLLENVWRGSGHITGYEAALATCMGHYSGGWNYERRAFERLCQQVEDGEWVVVEKYRHPMQPVYQQVEGEWQVSRDVWGVYLRNRLEQQLKRIKRQQQERELLQSQRVPVSAFIIEDIEEWERRPVTLGPHEEPGYQESGKKFVYTGPPDEGIESVISPMDVVDAMLEGTAIEGLRDYLPTRHNAVKRMKPDVEPKSSAGQGGVAKGAEETIVRTTRSGEQAARITRPDGSVIDISPTRVKEYVPNTHPNAPPGTLDRVKFPDALPGSKGYKRAPTLEELDILRGIK